MEVGRNEDVIKQIKRSGAQKIKVAFCDINGQLSEKYLHVTRFLSATESGLNIGQDCFLKDFDGQPMKIGSLNSYVPSDMILQFDVSTGRTIPWEDDMPFFLGDFIDTAGRAAPICPRQILKQVIAQAEVSGLFPKFTIELPWILLDSSSMLPVHESVPQSVITSQKISDSETPWLARPDGSGSEFAVTQSADLQQLFVNDLLSNLDEFNVPIDGLEVSYEYSRFEPMIQSTDALEAADRVVLVKKTAKELGRRYATIPTFIAFWDKGWPANTTFYSQFLENESRENTFITEQNNLSKIGRRYLAGLLHCLPDILCVLAPTVNSYKRIANLPKAVRTVNYSFDSTPAALRFTGLVIDRSHIQLGVAGSDVNCYLATAAMLAAGLYGIENNLDLEEFDPEDIENDLPQNLFQATQKFSESDLARELLGDSFVDYFSLTRMWEWKQFEKTVTDWEKRRYLANG